MLHMPGVLVAQYALLALREDLEQQGRNIGFVAQILKRSEQRFEVEDDGAGEREATQGLPVDAHVNA